MSNANDTLPESTGRLSDVLREARDLERELEAAVSGVGLTADEWLALDALRRRGPLSMSQLSECVAASGATLTRLADALVGRALVYREVSASDRRRVEVHVSELGVDALLRAAPQVAVLELSLDERVSLP